MARLHTAGFNAFHQLSRPSATQPPDPTTAGPDIRSFTTLLDNNGKQGEFGAPAVFYASWSTTAFTAGDHVHSVGHQRFTIDIDQTLALHSPFGDHNGLLGCLDAEGHVHYLVEAPGTGTWALGREAADAERPLLSHIIQAGNGRVAVTFKQAPNAKLTHVAEFASCDAFRRWHSNPSDPSMYPAAHHMVSGRPRQLAANAANFTMLMESGEVYTWGDPRFRTLARSTTGEDSVPASQAGVVEALGGLRIEKIACGAGHGWLSAALSEDGAVYLWGASMPGGEGETRCLKEAGAGEVALVELPSNGSGAEPEDVVVMAVGTNHAAVVTASGRLFVVGENKNGQLGLGSEQAFFTDWTEVSSLSNVQHVFCAPQATFATTA